MTAKLVDDVTDTHSDKSREALGQGIANIVTGIFGGMGGCAMIGQTMINVKASGARTRISTFMAGALLLLMVMALGDLVGLIPMAALVAVMLYVSFITFDWHSLAPATLRRLPRSETGVMVVTVAVVVATQNLAIGVGVGVLAAMVMFARRVAHFVTVRRSVIGSGEAAIARYVVDGELFFASSNDLYSQFNYADDPAQVVVDMGASHLWDASTSAALDGIQAKYRRLGKHVKIVGLNDASARMRTRLAGKLNAGQ
jgi:SulP family sulfate permease